MSGKKKDPLYHELERISHKDLKSYRNRSKDLSNYHREHFQYFAEQRKIVFESLLESIRKNCSSYTFNHYQRATSYKYSRNPLSARGSLLSETGGRFNIGDINPNIPKFSALYLAKDKETAIKEAFQVVLGPVKGKQGLSGEDLALLDPSSLCIVPVDGYLEQGLDLTNKDNLKDFFNVVKHIKLPKYLLDKAKKFKVSPCPEIRTLAKLHNTILETNYKQYPMLFDLPSNSQILGHIAFEAGIQAIKYPSKFTEKTCLAIYPDNFEYSDSYVQIHPSVTPDKMPDPEKRMDKGNYKYFL